MERVGFVSREQNCLDVFNALGEVYNACTPENHHLVFRTETDFKAAMSILALCAVMFPGIVIFAFQLMSNHMHLVVSGKQREIMDFFNYFVTRLDKYFEGNEDLSEFELKLFPITDLGYFRNAIVYVNRNGFVVNPDVTPFSYPWGSTQYYFSPLAVRYFERCCKPVGIMFIRELLHTKNADAFRTLRSVDGYVSPLEFCNVNLAQRTFRDARQYAYMIMRNVESYSEVARSLGESVFYNDNDLYLVAKRIAGEKFGTKDLVTLPAAAKLDLARRLHFDYNANVKQIQRLLRMDANVVKAIM